MVLVADSGSTKTDWRLIDGLDIQAFQSVGLNPYFVDEAGIAEVLKSLLPVGIRQAISAVYFYGAGCGTAAQQEKVRSGIAQVLEQATIHVDGDLLAAARATCGAASGITCILGTGSNSCLFIDGEIVASSPSNGIWLGDEGSAGYLGKRLITDYLNLDLPLSVHQKFEAQYQDRRPEILDRVYKQAAPNAYLAGFAKFIGQYLSSESYLQKITQEAFEDFIEKTILGYANYQKYPIHFVGGVAHHFREMLLRVCQRYQLKVQKIMKTPIEGLVDYHRQLLK